MSKLHALFDFSVTLAFCRMLSNLLCHQSLLQVIWTWRKQPGKNEGGLKSRLKVKERSMDHIPDLMLLLRAKRFGKPIYL